MVNDFKTRNNVGSVSKLAGLATTVIFLSTPLLAQVDADRSTAEATTPRGGAILVQEDTVVVADFENKTGEAVFDGALKGGLLLVLGQSPFLNLVPEGKVKENLQALGRSTTEPIRVDVARIVCMRTGSKAILSGTLSGSSGRYLLDLNARACSSGVTLAEKHNEVRGREDVLRRLSQASSSLREQLGEPLSSVRRFNTPVETATNCLEALKNYSTGTSLQHEKGDAPSMPFFTRAIELDSNFPLPYAALAGVHRNLQQPSLALEFATKAYQLRERANEREKLRISAAYYSAMGEMEKEIQTYEEWQTLYPRDFVPYNNLGDDYFGMGMLEKSLAEYREAVRLTPTVAGYSNLMGADLSLNLLDDAKAAYDEACARKLDGRYVRQTFYWLAFLKRDVADMEEQVAWAAGKPGDEDFLLSLKSDTEAYYGHLSKAHEFTRRAMDSAVLAKSKETAALWQVNSALREAELGNADPAKQQVTSALGLSDGRDVELMAALTLARAGDNAGATALVTKLEKNYPTATLMKLYWLPTIHAAIELDRGNASQALKDLEAAKPYEQGGAGTIVNYLYPAYLRGQAYLLAHNPNAALAEFQKLVDHNGIVLNFVTGALVHLQLGRAYAIEGKTAKAKTAYQDFFALWNGADSEIPALREAKAEYAELH